MKKLTIDRSVLLTPAEQKRRGLKTGRLCTDDGTKMCCLGIALHDAGVKKVRLKGLRMPNQILKTEIPPECEWMGDHRLEGSHSYRLAVINDNPELHWRERERLLTEQFAETGIDIELTFVKRYTLA